MQGAKTNWTNGISRGNWRFGNFQVRQNEWKMPFHFRNIYYYYYCKWWQWSTHSTSDIEQSRINNSRTTTTIITMTVRKILVLHNSKCKTVKIIKQFDWRFTPNVFCRQGEEVFSSHRISAILWQMSTEAIGLKSTRSCMLTQNFASCRWMKAFDSF